MQNGNQHVRDLVIERDFWSNISRTYCIVLRFLFQQYCFIMYYPLYSVVFLYSDYVNVFYFIVAIVQSTLPNSSNVLNTYLLPRLKGRRKVDGISYRWLDNSTDSTDLVAFTTQSSVQMGTDMYVSVYICKKI